MNASRSSPPVLPWTARLCRVCDRIERNPQHLLAWEWRAEKRVLMFLIMRYGDGPPIPWHFAAHRPRPVLSLPDEPLSPRLPRTPVQIRCTLERIADANCVGSDALPRYGRHVRYRPPSAPRW